MWFDRLRWISKGKKTETTKDSNISNESTIEVLASASSRYSIFLLKKSDGYDRIDTVESC